MRKLLAVAALLLASSAAQAQYTFEYGGRTIRVDPDRGTVSIPGVYDNTKQKTKRARDQDSERPQKQAPQEAKTEPRAPAASPAPSEQAVAPPATGPIARASSLYGAAARHRIPSVQPRRRAARPRRRFSRRPRLP